MMTISTRAGRYISQPTGYRSFVPAPLPPDPPLQLDAELVMLLSQADQSIGRLDGISRVVPNPDLFVATYVRQEAVLSSRIEGTRSTLDDVLIHEIDDTHRGLPEDIVEVTNYVRALQHGLQRLDSLPLSLRLIREIHAELMRGVRGQEKDPGEFRRSQNWIGRPGATLANAIYVPPAPADMWQALDRFERFLHEPGDLPLLIHAGIAHAHFEMIHPFLDGNGRVGRLLITLLLCTHSVLRLPLLYLSQYLNDNRPEYYDRLTAIHRRGDWEGWVVFFLRGVQQTADDATRIAYEILNLFAEHTTLIRSQSASPNAPRLLEYLFTQPIVDVNQVRDQLGVTFQTADSLVRQFASLGLLEEITGGQRSRKFRYSPYLRLFERADLSKDLG
jgi:Fic family protein